MDFPVGYEKFHKKQHFNFQLNRWYSWGYLRKRTITRRTIVRSAIWGLRSR